LVGTPEPGPKKEPTEDEVRVRGFVPSLGAFALLSAAPPALAGLVEGQTRPLPPWPEDGPFASLFLQSTAPAESFELTHTGAVTDRAVRSIPSIFSDATLWPISSVPQSAAPVPSGARWTRAQIADDLPRSAPPVERPSILSADFDARNRVGILFGGDPEGSGNTLARFIPAPGTVAIWIGAMSIATARRRRSSIENQPNDGRVPIRPAR